MSLPSLLINLMHLCWTIILIYFFKKIFLAPNIWTIYLYTIEMYMQRIKKLNKKIKLENYCAQIFWSCQSELLSHRIQPPGVANTLICVRGKEVEGENDVLDVSCWNRIINQSSFILSVICLDYRHTHKVSPPSTGSHSPWYSLL